MAEESTTTTGAEGGATTTGATTEGAGAGAAGTSGAAPTHTTEEKEAGYWRRQAEKHQKDLEKLQKAEADRQKAAMSETERAKAEKAEADKRAEAAEKRAKDTLLRARFETAATKAGCHDAEAAWQLVDKAGLEVDEHDKVLGLDKAIEALKKGKSYLFGTVRATTGSGGGNTSGATAETTAQRMNKWLRGG